jgi:hypothetical protein
VVAHERYYLEDAGETAYLDNYVSKITRRALDVSDIIFADGYCLGRWLDNGNNAPGCTEWVHSVDLDMETGFAMAELWTIVEDGLRC